MAQKAARVCAYLGMPHIITKNFEKERKFHYVGAMEDWALGILWCLALDAWCFHGTSKTCTASRKPLMVTDGNSTHPAARAGESRSKARYVPSPIKIRPRPEIDSS